MLTIEQLGVFHSIICLHGEIPKKEFFVDFNLPIVAVDGASILLHQIGIEPQLIIGDLDSDDPNIFSRVERIFTPDQDYSDFQKSLVFLNEKQLTPAIILGISGGYIDHILQNISIFSSTNSIFMTDNQIGFVVDNQVELRLPSNSKLSIMGCPYAIVNSCGLKWELKSHQLEICGFNSLSNRTIAEKIKIEVMNGKALVIIYTNPVIDAGALFA